MTTTAMAASQDFCPACGWPGFCQPNCTRTTAQERYCQRTAYHARIMLALAANDEARGYWSGRLAWAELALKGRNAHKHSHLQAA